MRPAARFRASGSFRYQTGTPVGVDDDDVVDLIGRPGSETVDFESGRVKARHVTRPPRRVDIRARRRAPTRPCPFWMNNVTDQTYAFNFGNPFSGTHFGAGSPRRRLAPPRVPAVSPVGTISAGLGKPPFHIANR